MFSIRGRTHPHPLPGPRQYPRGLGKNILDAWQSVQGRARLDFRQKLEIDPKKTDLEIFESMSNTDPLTDAKIPSLFLYLYQNKNLVIPEGWKPAMDAMSKEMQHYAARLWLFELSCNFVQLLWQLCLWTNWFIVYVSTWLSAQVLSEADLTGLHS